MAVSRKPFDLGYGKKIDMCWFLNEFYNCANLKKSERVCGKHDLVELPT